MRPNPQPVLGRPFRNVWCEAYSNCLDLAIQNQWPSFSCRWCAYKTSRPHDWREQALADQHDCWSLMAAVFYPEYRWRTRSRPCSLNQAQPSVPAVENTPPTETTPHAA